MSRSYVPGDDQHVSADYISSMSDYCAPKSFRRSLSFSVRFEISIRIHTVVCNHLRGNEYMWTTVRDYGIVRTTPWNETSSRERNNNIRVSILFSFSFLFFFLLFCYLLRISRLKKREKERNGKRETIDENFSIHRDNR